MRAYFKSTRALFKQDKHAENRSQGKNQKNPSGKIKNILITDARLSCRTSESGKVFDTNKRRIMSLLQNSVSFAEAMQFLALWATKHAFF